MPTRIILNKRDKTIKVVNRKTTIRLQQSGRVGPTGEQGDKGDTGKGTPKGGLAGQVLIKKSNSTYDFDWFTPNFLDKNVIVDFTVTDTVAVIHNLKKYPAVSVIDSAGDEVEGDVNYINDSRLVVTFNAPFSGRITCN